MKAVQLGSVAFCLALSQPALSAESLYEVILKEAELVMRIHQEAINFAAETEIMRDDYQVDSPSVDLFRAAYAAGKKVFSGQNQLRALAYARETVFLRPGDARLYEMGFRAASNVYSDERSLHYAEALSMTYGDPAVFMEVLARSQPLNPAALQKIENLVWASGFRKQSCYEL